MQTDVSPQKKRKVQVDSSQGKLVCSDPHIWVFDGLLSDSLLKRVDEAFEQVKWKSMNGRRVRIVELNVDEVIEELPRTLCAISHIEEVAPCRNVWIMDVQGRDQGAHMDGWEVSPNREYTKHLDMSKCSVQTHKGFNTVIPTLSFVIYFNDVGGCAFPKAAMPNPTVPAKRGRILMFHNYNDSQRPAHNPAAVHFGVYGDAPKRVMTAGVLSHETPWELLGASSDRKTQGVLYAPIMHRSNTSCGEPDPPRAPPAPPPQPKQVLQLLARRAEEAGGIIVEAVTLGGNTVAKVMVQGTDTLGTLRQALPDATLVAGDSILDGDDKQLVRDTSLVKALDTDEHSNAEGLPTGAFPAREPPRAPDVVRDKRCRCSQMSALGDVVEEQDVETGVFEWDVIDTRFV